MSSREQSASDGSVDFEVGLAGAYGAGNLGDDLLMCLMLDTIGEACPPDRVAVFCSGRAGYLSRWYPKAAFRTHPGPVDPPVRLRALIHGGGTRFFSFSNGRSRGGRRRVLRRLVAAGSHALRSPGSLLRRLRARGKPLPGIRFDSAAACCVGVGPFKGDPRSEVRTRLVLSGCAHLSVRDRLSLEQCRNWGFGGTVLRADPCYGSRLMRRLADAGAPRACDGPDVLVVVRDWPHTVGGAAYFEPLLSAARQLRAQGLRVEYCSFAAARDSEVLRKLGREGEAVSAWDPEEYAVEEFAGRLRASRLVISARAHGAILAAVTGVPPVCIEVEPKLRMMAEQLEDGAALWRQPFDRADLVRLVTAMLDDYEGATAALAVRTRKLRRMADLAERELRDFVAATLRQAGSGVPEA